MPALRPISWTVDEKGCWNFIGTKNWCGYGVVVRGGRQRPAHVWKWIETYGPIPKGMKVCHHCDNPPCVNPEHLFLGTQADNLRDMAEKGRVAHGSAHHWAKLTEEEVVAIRQSGGSNSSIARRYGVNQSTVSRIRARLRWQWAERDLQGVETRI